MIEQHEPPDDFGLATQTEIEEAQIEEISDDDIPF